jgi:hypothetical protein
MGVGVIAKYAHPNNGREYEQVEVNSLCKVDGEYELASVNMKQDRTTIRLSGLLVWFNSVFFDFYEDGKEIDIYTDPRFNPFIRGHSHVD